MPHRKSPFVAAIAAAALLGLSSMAQAAPTTWTIDPNHSNVTFTIRHFFSKVTGSFTKFSGKIVYDPANVAATSAQADIDAARNVTANQNWDWHRRRRHLI